MSGSRTGAPHGQKHAPARRIAVPRHTDHRCSGSFRPSRQIAELKEQARAAEAKHSALVERLASQARDGDELRAEVVALRRVAAEVRSARDEHAMALEMLGEKQEELDAALAKLESSGGA